MSNFITEKTQWRIIDDHWTNVYRDFHQDKNVHSSTLYNGVLADYLWLVGFDIPDSINYCLAENSEYELKFRKLGGMITIFLRPRK